MFKHGWNIKTKVRNYSIAAGMALMVASSPLAITGFAQAESGIIHLTSSQNAKKLKITLAKPKTIRTDLSFSEIVVGDPGVATVSPLTDRSFYVIGTAAGTTGIALYDAESNLVGLLDVEVGANTNQINSALDSALPRSSVKATTSNGRVLLKGKANNAVDAAKAREIAKKFDPQLIDTVKIKGSQQVSLEVRFIEASRNKGKRLRVNVSGSRATGSASTVLGGSVLADITTGAIPFGQFVTNLITNGTNVDVVIDALEEQGLARNLAEPNLVALSGDTASFLAGGEFPIPISDGDGATTVEFKPFGVGLKFSPTVLEGGIINLKLAPEVSTLDFANAVQITPGADPVPALVVRRAETTLELRDGQSFVIGGLLQKNSSFAKSQLPLIGDIPVLGALFRSSSFQKNETDLVIIVTPRLVKPLRPNEEPATPVDATAPANEVEFFANGTLEVSRSHLRKLAEARNGALKSGHIINLE